MKKIIFGIILSIICFYNVYAKDISYSMNKYDDEVFNYIEKAYDKDLKEDGYVLGGNILKEEIEKDDDTYRDYQVILVKYDKNDKLVWKYIYGDTKEDYIDYLTYTYDENGSIDGYLIVTKKTHPVEEPSSGSDTVLIKIDFEGKLVYEKDIVEGNITKIIPIKDGYISIMNTQVGSSLVKYTKNFDIVFKRDFIETTLSDLTVINEKDEIIGYAVINGNNLVSLDVNGYNDVVISDLSNYKSSKLSKFNSTKPKIFRKAYP